MLLSFVSITFHVLTTFLTQVQEYIIQWTVYHMVQKQIYGQYKRLFEDLQKNKDICLNFF